MKKLILVDPNAELCKEWRKKFKGLPNVMIVNDRFENLGQFDCMVSAANSFGLMDGGVDLAIMRGSFSKRAENNAPELGD